MVTKRSLGLRAIVNGEVNNVKNKPVSQLC